MIKTLLLTGFALIYYTTAIAQSGGETTVPLGYNAHLQQIQYPAEKKASLPIGFGKTTGKSLVPFVERFNYTGTELNDSLWVSPKDVKKNGRTAIFNAQDAIGSNYGGGDNVFRQNDVLTTKDFSLSGISNDLFIDFTYSMGSTWQTGDSLVLEVKTNNGNYARIWVSSTISVAQTNVRLNLDVPSLAIANFTFRFVSYTTSSATNTETFLLHGVIASTKLSIPFYENFAPFNKDSTPPPINWQQAPGALLNGSRFGWNTGSNVFVMNAFDENNGVYNNANNQIGFADTLQSMPFDITKFSASDSIFFRFYFQSPASVSNTDSLIVEWMNNVGQWIRVFQSGITNGNNRVFIRQLNFGRFRHGFFQFRIINKTRYSANDSLQFLVTGIHIGNKLNLPFIDDFSSAPIFPDARKWKDKWVYVNNDFAIRPPSVNVATFDGLDFRGNPYGQGNGICDTLTSQAVNLSNLRRQDSVYLSFFIQPKGLGAVPGTEDFLYLEFRTNGGFFANDWQRVWSASVTNYPTNRFTQIYLLIDSAYLHDDFQFRFTNYGSRTGNLNNWHLDYIQLDRGRTQNDGYFDAALSNTPPSLLKPYYAMPRKHYDVNPSTFNNSVQNLVVRLNHSNPSPLNYGRVTFNAENVSIDSFGNTGGFLNAKTDTTVSIFSTFPLNNSSQSDSIAFRARYYTNLNNNLDNIVTNDTMSIVTLFSNFFAYDDGTAEAGYGIKNKAGSVALGYKLETADTLQGISMFFNQAGIDVSQQAFNLMVWSSINKNSSGERVLKRIPFIRPVYTNQRNGFYYFKLDEPLLLPAGTFYIGWEQLDPFILNMGFDRNFQLNGDFAKNAEMYYKLNDQIWRATNENGALMMRPLIGKWLNPPVGMNELKTLETKLTATVYPNPATNYIQIDANFTQLKIDVLDITGRIIASNQDFEKIVHLPTVNTGLYIVKITNVQNGQSLVQKLIINP